MEVGLTAVGAPRFEFPGASRDDAGTWYVIAELPQPYQSPAQVTPELVDGPPQAALTISYRRWGTESPVIVSADPATRVVESGRLSRPLEFVDGPEPEPTLTLRVDDPMDLGPGFEEYVLSLSGVQHGDVVVFTDTVSATVGLLPIVKNFSRHDLLRLRSAGYDLGLPEPFTAAAPWPGTIVATASFVLADGPDTEQEAERATLAAALAGRFPDAVDDPRRADLATLDIPSARGIGLFPDDASHLHLLMSQVPPALGALLPTFDTDSRELADATIAVPDGSYEDSTAFRRQVLDHRDALRARLAAIVTEAAAAPASSRWHPASTASSSSPKRPTVPPGGSRRPTATTGPRTGPEGWESSP